jgi:hypothetical protein
LTQIIDSLILISVFSSYNEELLNKDKEIINLKLELEKARNRILTMTNQLNNNVSFFKSKERESEIL